jgi:transcriptional regulator of PTS gene
MEANKMFMFEKAISQKLMKNMNQQMVLNLIYSEGHISRVELAEKTGLTQQTVTNIINRLLLEKVVIEGTPSTSSGGRKPIPLSINNSNLFAIGVEVSVKYVRGVVIDFQREIKLEIEEQVAFFLDEKHTLACISHVIDRLLEEMHVKELVKGIGLSIQGLVDSRQGVVLLSEKLKWKNYKLLEKLEQLYPYPIYIENDVNILALLENMDGLLVSSENNITLKFDEGIGGAIVCNNLLYTGSTHVAGEFGHYKAFYNEQARPCHCGGKGCLTTMASVGGLQEITEMSLKQIVQKIAADDPEMKALMHSIGAAIAGALANIITFINPDHILLTGKLIEEAGDMLLPLIEVEVKQQLPIHCKNVRIVHLTKSPDHAENAAGLVIKQMFAAPLNTLSY